MATNEILKFGENATGGNILTQASYDADAQRLIGHQPGIARQELENKAMRQSSLVAAAVAQLVADYQAVNVVDTLTPAVLAGYLKTAINAAGITASQFDNSTKLATTGFVRQNAGSLSGRISISTNLQTIPISAIGGAVNLSGAAVTVYLPQTSQCPAGSTITIENETNVVTLTRSSTDAISTGTGSPTSIQIGIGDTVTLESNALGAWRIISGSGQLPYSNLFQASKVAAQGYARLPNGMVEQWGAGVTNASGILSVTFNPTFAVIPTIISSGNTGGPTTLLTSFGLQTAAGCQIYSANSTTGVLQASAPVQWRAVGWI